MIKVVDGRRYDTDRATLIAQYSNRLPVTDFRHVEEELYRTDKGAWFLYGSGGPMTQYRVSAGDGWGGGSDILPMDDSEAQAWLERYDETEVLERFFTLQDA